MNKPNRPNDEELLLDSCSFRLTDEEYNYNIVTVRDSLVCSSVGVVKLKDWLSFYSQWYIESITFVQITDLNTGIAYIFDDQEAIQRVIKEIKK